jgi:hypothetical protein
LDGFGKALIVFGLLAAGLGLLFVLLARAGIPRLPGDMSIDVGSVRIWLPIGTSILLSIVLTLGLSLLARLHHPTAP